MGNSLLRKPGKTDGSADRPAGNIVGMNDAHRPAGPGRLFDPSRWRPREALLAGLALGVVIELVTVVARFGLGLKSTQSTGFLSTFTLGLRIHHGYLGVLMLLAAWPVRRPEFRRWLVVVGLALVVSDLLHHFAVLWPITGSPEFDLVYPGPPPEAPTTTQLTFLGTAAWVAGWAVRLVMLGVVPVSRPPASAAAWLLTIFLFPWAGLALYVLIGSPRMPGWRRRKLARFTAETAPIREKARAALSDKEADVDGPLAPVARLSERLGHFPVACGNGVEFLADYDATLARVAADIDAARHHAHLLYYIAAADPATEPVMAALERAAARGVRCRLVYDDHGSKAFARGLRARLAGTGVDVRAALPVRFFARRATRADLRNHRKIVAVDGRVGYVGSQNLVDRGFKAGIEYEDFVARVEGPLVAQLQLVFASDWWLETDELLTDPAYFPPPGEPGPAVGQVLPSGPEFPSQNFQRVLVDVVHQARRQVTVVTPYLVPDDALLQAFETATHRKVRVRVIVSKTTDQALVRLCQESYYAQMLGTGVELYRYRGPFLHAKHATADADFGLIGSCNADIRSFQLNSEVSLLLYDPGTTAGVLAREEEYIARADRLTKEEWAARPRWRRLAENLARIWSPLL